MSAHDRFARLRARFAGLIRPAVLSVALSLIIAVGLVVPDSEVRAKVFRVQLIIKNIGRLAVAEA